ncbi:hypothetical protein [Nocardia sp. NPDC051750]|uniref:hypothetical protein n=1 Tax=Nocardia sp. NPDC051750 TaxID=3364325 RepID=UPI00379EBC00
MLARYEQEAGESSRRLLSGGVMFRKENAASILRVKVAEEFGPEPMQTLQQLMNYVLQAGEVGRAELTRLVEDFGQIHPLVKDAAVTTAEMLEDRGRVAARIEDLLELMTERFGDLPADAVHRIESASSDQLRAWIKRVLHANTVDDVFGGTHQRGPVPSS